uniref:Uncharacterized protein n=1 Tax=Candidatus Kentrum sp. LFY TaxID=2126342 RepID=A0A450UY12_9GAMM|nr:MAG: hypothetical protein BECKLFY1418B_GA0070995_106919 [Candidatus Kentron sp. LFY]VFJ97426.1 MAG: hypothetical protein BECKLFY1418A_GA0070994_106920 [Candidatus Kentron sp. LFY]
MFMHRLIIPSLMLRIGKETLWRGRLRVIVVLRVRGKVHHLQLKLLRVELLMLFESLV